MDIGSCFVLGPLIAVPHGQPWPTVILLRETEKEREREGGREREREREREILRNCLLTVELNKFRLYREGRGLENQRRVSVSVQN